MRRIGWALGDAKFWLRFGGPMRLWDRVAHSRLGAVLPLCRNCRRMAKEMRRTP
jgi:hypothetical protein